MTAQARELEPVDEPEAYDATSDSGQVTQSHRQRAWKCFRKWGLPIAVSLVFIGLAVLLATVFYYGRRDDGKDSACRAAAATCPPCPKARPAKRTPSMRLLRAHHPGTGLVYRRSDGKFMCVGAFLAQGTLLAPATCFPEPASAAEAAVVSHGREVLDVGRVFRQSPAKEGEQEPALVLIQVSNAAANGTSKTFVKRAPPDGISDLPLVNYEPPQGSERTYEIGAAFGWAGDGSIPVQRQVVVYPFRVCQRYFGSGEPFDAGSCCSIDVLPRGFTGIVMVEDRVVGVWSGTTSRDVAVIRDWSTYRHLFPSMSS